MTAIAELHARDLFDSLGKEDEQPEQRRPEVKTNPVIERLIIVYEGELKEACERQAYPYWNYHKKPREEIEKIARAKNFTGRDVSSLCLLLQGKEDNLWFSVVTGYFLGVCSTNASDSVIRLPLRHFRRKLCYVGAFNNCGKHIIVEGDVERGLGHGMIGGQITVNGNVGEDVGHGMQDGEIYIDGDYISLSYEDIRRGKGKIFHKGRQIL